MEHHRRSIRLRGWDYTNNGYYFVTICAKNRNILFGNIVNNQIILNEFGEILKKEILITPIIRKNIIIDEYQIMPNHVHLIVRIDNPIIPVGAYYNTPLPAVDNKISKTENQIIKFTSPKQCLGSIVRGIKGGVVRNLYKNGLITNKEIWQRNYHERIVRNTKEYYAKKIYMANNPKNWLRDINNPITNKSTT